MIKTMSIINSHIKTMDSTKAKAKPHASKTVKSKNKVIKKKQECSICCDDIVVDNIIHCTHHECQFSCCKTCYKRYLSDNPTATKCMECEKVYDHKLLIQMLGKSFVVGDLRQMQKRVWLEKQLAQMPATQASNEFKIAKLYKDLATFEKELREKMVNEPDMFSDLLKQLQDEKWRVNDMISDLRNPTQQAKREVAFAFIMKCEQTNCRGFVNKKYVCEVCKTIYCKKCNVKLETSNGTEAKVDSEKHECNKDDIETAKMILSESKPCPSCGTRISKVSGCDQMWCTQCHITFSWRTGNIEKGMVHNPHYFEWLRTTSNNVAINNPGNIQCGQYRGIEMFTTLFNTIKTDSIPYYSITDFNTLNISNFPLQDVKNSKLIDIYVELKNYVNAFKEMHKEKIQSANVGNTSLKFLTTLFEKTDKKINEILGNDETLYVYQTQAIGNFYHSLIMVFVEFDKIIKKKLTEIKMKCTRLYEKSNNNSIQYFYAYFREITHIHAFELCTIRRTLERTRNENYMLKKRIDYLLGKTTEKQLCESASRREYTIKREQSKLHLYEFVHTVGVEETNSLYTMLNDKQFNIIPNYNPFVSYTNEQIINKEFLEKFKIMELVFLDDNSCNDFENHVSNILSKFYSSVNEFNEKLANAFRYYNEQMKIVSKEYNCKVKYIEF